MIRDRKRLVKLVRDRVGTFLPPRGVTTYEPLEDPELHRRMLRGKLIEEAVEYLQDPSVEEAADVYTALCAIVTVDLGIGMSDLYRVADAKYAERGGFEDGTGMWVETDERISPHERGWRDAPRDGRGQPRG